MPDTLGRFGFVPLVQLPHPTVLLAVLGMRTRLGIEGLTLPRLG